MIQLPFAKGKTYAVYGLGKTGIAAVTALQAAGAHVVAWDESREKVSEAAKVNMVTGNLLEIDIAKFDGIVVSPGISLEAPVVIRFREARIPVLSDISLLRKALPNSDFIGITGTNGKSTTTALLGHVLERFMPVRVGGNIGVASLSLNPPDDRNTAYVLELSSYQLDLSPALPMQAGIFLNLTKDHLERHKTMDGYFAAKRNLFNHAQMRDDRTPVAVVAIDDAYGRELCEDLEEGGRWHVVPVSVGNQLDYGVYVKGGILYDALSDSHIRVCNLDESVALKGAHNHQNAACVYALARAFYNYDPAQIAENILDFGGLPHRQFPVRTIHDVVYVNDSKATNADATSKALGAYENIYWILGGQPKEGGLTGLESYMGKVRHAYLIGEATEAFAVWLDAQKVPFSKCGNLDRAVAAAHFQAQHDATGALGAGTVLLSPACASWDQFNSYEHRGDIFASLVMSLSEELAA